MTIFQWMAAILEARHQAKLAYNRAYNKAWRKKYPEKIAASRRRWRERHPDKTREGWTRWAKRNPERAKAVAKEQRERRIRENPDRYADLVAGHIEAVERGSARAREEDFWFSWPQGARVTIAHYVPTGRQSYYEASGLWASAGSCVDPQCLCKRPAEARWLWKVWGAARG